MSEEYHEPVFDAGSFICNNAPFTRKCIACKQDIHGRSVHQKTDHGCQETEIHVHQYSYYTGICTIKGCIAKLDEKTLKRYINEMRPNLVK